MKAFRPLLLLLLPLLAGACEKDDSSHTEIWTVAPEKGVTGIHTGFGHVPAYLLKKGSSATWEASAETIAGFRFERGYEKVVRVRLEPIANPPADGPGRRCTMVQELSRTPAACAVDPLTFSPEYEILVASVLADADPAVYWIQDLRYDSPEWLPFPWKIEGFDFKPGYETRLRIRPTARYDESTDDYTVHYDMTRLCAEEQRNSEGGSDPLSNGRRFPAPRP
ncbi:MAG TPA: DUF4377 domain-containing protein [Candidatus Alistipes faecigallinarum]|nr:DUF4377 domain-containing protein [Candidatus Alistipes faecigallinarum]